MLKKKLINQVLFIVPTSERENEIKKEYASKHNFLKVVTLPHLLNEIFELYDDSKIVLDTDIALSIIYKLIVDSKNNYFKYLKEQSESLNTLYDYFIKLGSNGVDISIFKYSKEKKVALEELYSKYCSYKQQNCLADKSDILDLALENIDDYLKNYSEIYVDSFQIGDIKLVSSKKERTLLEKIVQKNAQQLSTNMEKTQTTLYQNSAFNAYDEVRIALKIAKKLMLENNNCNEKDIVIVTSDFTEYAPYFYNLLDEYGMKGYDTTGVALNSISTDENILKFHSQYNIQKAYWDYDTKLNKTISLLEHFNLPHDKEHLKEKILQNIFVRSSKEGILFTDPNKFIGTQHGFKHIIFIGSDITHFPPKQSKNFLYTNEQSVKLFNTNNVYDASKTLYDELKRLSDNLYIVTASYNGKRKLAQSIIIDKNIDNIFNIENIQSRNDILKSNKTIELTALKAYQESMFTKAFTLFDGANLGKFKNGNKLSASALNTYEKCPMQYYFSSVLGLGSPEDETDGFDAAQRGSFMHLCLELFVKKVKEQKLTTLDKVYLYKLMFETSEEAYEHKETQRAIGKDKENINHIIDKAVFQNGLDDIESENKAELAKFVDYFVENEFEYFANSNPEEFFMLDDNFDVVDLKGLDINDEKDKEAIKKIDKEKRFIKGFIDRLDNLSSEVNIIDYKSSVGSKKMADFKQESLQDYQLGIYMLYAMQKYPNKAYEAHLLSFKSGDNKQTDKYFNTSISLSTHDGAKNIYNEEYSKTLKSKIKSIQEKINSGEFAFDNRDEKTCEYCNYNHICHQAVLNKEISNDEQ